MSGRRLTTPHGPKGADRRQTADQASTKAHLLGKRGRASLRQDAETAAAKRAGEVREALRDWVRRPPRVECEKPSDNGETVTVRLTLRTEAASRYARLRHTDALLFELQETIAVSAAPQAGEPAARLIQYTYQFLEAVGGDNASDTFAHTAADVSEASGDGAPAGLFRYEYQRGQTVRNGYAPEHHLHVTGLGTGNFVDRLHFPVFPFVRDAHANPQEVLPAVVRWSRQDPPRPRPPTASR